MAQQCIFCGKKPENKNKEHVIPQWLSKLVGSYDHVCNFGALTEKQITFGKLTFPACTACNTKFGDLEAATKIILDKVLAGNAITATEINTLLDWFDKIRVGMWLGQLMLVDEKRDIEPQFHIADRIGTKDRMLIVGSRTVRPSISYSENERTDIVTPICAYHYITPVLYHTNTPSSAQHYVTYYTAPPPPIPLGVDDVIGIVFSPKLC